MVHVVVGMDRLLRTHHSAGELDGAIGDHLIGVHVGLRARSGLEHHQRKLAVQLPVDHLLGRPDDQVDLVARQLAQFAVSQRGAFLEDAERADHRPAPAVALHADREVAMRPLRLCAPQMVRRNFDVS